MEELRKKAAALLESGAVKVVIGYAAGFVAGRSRPFFARNAERCGRLIYDEHCRQNLAVYLLKPEVNALGKAAVVARPATLRTMLQYAVENQIADESAIALAVDAGGGVVELPKFAAIEEHLASLPRGLSAEEQQDVARISGMSQSERWGFWAAEFARCVKCYACRAACPLCYCSRCITDCNQPQWIPAASTELGNLEWNVVRAMHLAGRCINCGSCADACPQHIRIDLLNHVLAQEAMSQFGAESGYSTRREYALSVFKPDDKEEFIR